jgi:hypothetical protein
VTTWADRTAADRRKEDFTVLNARFVVPVRRLARWTGVLTLGLWTALGSLGGALPSHAANFSLQGGAAKPAWSGYWWPMLQGGRGWHLYDEVGYYTPLLKYGGVNGDYGPLQWEKRYKRTSDPKTNWWGHCNGWAAATVMEAEPQNGVRAGQTYFNVGEIKGLLTACHQGDPVDLFRGRPHWAGADYTNDLRALDFHRALLYYLRDRKESVIFNISLKPEVWNYPAYKFDMRGQTDWRGSNLTNITVTLTFADDDVVPHYLGTKAFVRSYTYIVQGDPQSVQGSVNAEWTGESVRNHPQFVWHPAFARPHDPGLGEPPSGLNVDWVRRLSAASIPTQ